MSAATQSPHSSDTSPSQAPRKSSKVGLWLLLVLLIAGGAFAVWYFVLRGQSSGSSALAMRVIPAESDVVGGIDIGRILTSPEVRKLASDNGNDFAAIDKALADAGIAPGDIGSLAFGMVMDGATPKEVVFALEAKTDAKAMVAFLRMAVSQLPGPIAGLVSPDSVQAIEGTTAGSGIFLMGSGELFKKAVAMGQNPSAATADGGKVELALVQKALDEGATMWFAAPVPPDTFSGISGSMAQQMIGGAPSHFGASINVGSSIELRGAMHIHGGDASTITGALKTARKMVSGQLPEAQRALLDDIDLGGSGPVVTARITLSESALSNLMKQTR